MKFDKSKRVHRKNVDLAKMKTDRDKEMKRKTGKNSHRLHITKLLLLLTISFFFTTVPYSLFYALRLNTEIVNYTLKTLIIGLLAILAYARHAFNFIIYLSISPVIKTEIRRIYRIIRFKSFGRNRY
jgi:hypothetical protein